MDLCSMIYQRRSVRQYTNKPLDEKTTSSILDFCKNAKPLYPKIRTKAMIVDPSQVRYYLPWKAPHLIAIFSQNKPGYLENVGFLFQQAELYVQSMGLGACWLGLGKFRKAQLPEVPGMEFVIFIAFGATDEPLYREDADDFQRKSLSEIADREDPKLECARLAPSGTNAQPWYFTHEGEILHAFCSEAGFLRHKLLGKINRIDMGIALSHLYLENPDTFRFFNTTPEHTPKGYRYVGSFRLT